MGQDGWEYILCGDWNIAHKPIDLKNWRSNQKNSGFLPEERAWLDWAKNVGWRIDYQVATPALMDKIVRVAIYKDQRFSDHAPLIIDYALDPFVTRGISDAVCSPYAGCSKRSRASEVESGWCGIPGDGSHPAALH
jgi:endonuclease/exonuclease/phosphatase family protein